MAEGSKNGSGESGKPPGKRYIPCCDPVLPWRPSVSDGCGGAVALLVGAAWLQKNGPLLGLRAQDFWVQKALLVHLRHLVASSQRAESGTHLLHKGCRCL